MKAVDLFAGWGGFTLGAQAAGVDVVWAANHWPLAVRAHALNHPTTRHLCQDLRQADWSALPDYQLLLASPACQGHSQASQPRRRAYHDSLRATAWAVVDCVDVTNPSAFVVENVADFRRWRLFPVWELAMRSMGYRLQQVMIRASDHGVPQRRTRLFVVGTLPGIDVDLSGLTAPAVAEPAFGPCIDWDKGSWRSVADCRFPTARGRMETARRLHGDRCIVQNVTGHKGIPLTDPLRTITTGDQWVVVDGDNYRSLTVRENARGMGFPDHYRWPSEATRRDSIRGLGNAVSPPVATAIIERVKEAA